MYLVFTRMPGENYRRRLRSLLRVLVSRIWRADVLTPLGVNFVVSIGSSASISPVRSLVFVPALPQLWLDLLTSGGQSTKASMHVLRAKRVHNVISLKGRKQ